MVLLHAFPPGKSADAHHEHQRNGIHDDAPDLDEQNGFGRHQHTVHQPGPDPNPHPGEEHDKKEIHHIPGKGVVEPLLPEEPTGLQEGIGDLAAEDDGINFCSRLAQGQRHSDPQDADSVMGQHQCTFGLEVDTPAQIKEEVAQTHTQRMNLKSGVG